jgi:dipeptidyl aminopeptidase/acylaminoacyl peptidase
MSDLDDLERELGPALRSALHRVAAHITVAPEAPMTEGKLMTYIKTPTEHEPTSDRNGGRRRPIGFIAVAVLAAAALVLAVIALARSGQDDGSPADEPVATTAPPTPTTSGASAAIPSDAPYFLDLDTGEKTPLPDSLVKGSVPGYVVSPDRTRFMFNTCCTEDDLMSIANADGTEVEDLAAADGSGRYVGRWSPDGTKIVYQERDDTSSQLGKLIVHDLTTDEQTTVVDFGSEFNGSWFLGPAFSPDGERVIYHRPHGTDPDVDWDAWSVPVTGGEPTLLLANAMWPIYSPDGEELVYVTPTENLSGDSIVIASADGSVPRTLVTASSDIFSPTMSPDGTRLAYADGGAIYVVEIATGQITPVADVGFNGEWFDDDTLIVAP